ERPIPFGKERLAATRAYIVRHYGVSRPDARIEPVMVVLHWTGIGSLEASWRTFQSERLPAARSDIAGGGDVNVSAHFLVDRDGTVYRLMPETLMARHVIGLNLSAVGVENVGGTGDKEDLTPAQARADAWLVRDLKDRFPGIRYLIGHYEYRRFEGTPLWREKDRSYRTVKSDPGPRFMRAVRERVADLGLKGAP
ncbi:MAG: N-acetylmuramoyl-L-alanine amidase, partial [Elusimicrobia bacterium]|nr:N-acetylmuramoyl-L-alanine amidase [Elusimicrobiota bacterium]